MKKLLTASLVCAVAVGLVAVPGAGAVKVTKEVFGTVSVTVTPNPVPDATTTVTASGNVASNSSCRKDRTVSLAYSSNPGAVVGTAVTGPNGDYTAPNLPKPTTSGDTLLATVLDGGFRKVGSKKKGKKTKRGRQFHCNAIGPTASAPITLEPPPAT
jgi:hypothetical protein